MRYLRPFTVAAFFQLFVLVLAGLTAAYTDAKAQCGTTISVFPYFENFEAGQGGWTAGGVGSDWAWGTPAKMAINSAASGTKCWVTGGLTGSFYTFGQRSFVESPCFNFTLMNHPYIKIKIWWESEQRFDGSNLQYSLDAGATWTNVGGINDPVDCLNENWYNQAPVTYLSTLATPRDGWSGNMQPTSGSCLGGSGSGGWVEAKHCMPYLANKPSVKFRFTFGAGTTCNNFDGVAFDDVYIGSAPAVGVDFSKICAGGTTYNFTDLSINCPDTWNWNFGDPASGANNTSTLQNPTHAFSGPGVYSVTLKASNMCSGSSTITQSVTIFGVGTAMTKVDCFGSATGSATASLTQGNGNPTYVWSTSPQQFGATAINLTAGIYTVTVTDAGVCPATATVTVTQPPVLQHTASSTPAACGNPTGTATVVASGGTLPYSYTWSPSGGSNATANNLPTGNYVVSINDQNGCQDTAHISVGALPALQAAVGAQTNVSCFGGNNGSATVSAMSGTMPFSYNWPGGGTNPTKTGLSVGSYTVTITDANLCTATTTVIITQPTPFSHQISKTAATCGGSDGTATITQAGGTAPYTFSWPSGAPIGNSASGLSPGNYVVSVTDQLGCSDTVHLTITNVPGVQATLATVVSATCFGGNNGSATVSTSAGVQPFTYAWSPTGGNAATATGLSAGTYTVTVTDANACTSTATAVVGQAPQIKHTVSSSPAACGAVNGMATVSANGGAPPYTYLWSPTGGNAATASNLASGLYIVSITDQNSCVDTAVVQIGNLAGLSANITNIVPVNCFGSNNGAATVTLTGGTAPFAYTWSPSGGTGATASGLSAGLYNVQIKDANNCIATASVQLSQPQPFQHNVALQPVSCNNANGAAVITVTGGKPPFTYNWSAGGSVTNSASNLAAGNYTVTVTDLNNCIDTVHLNVGAIPPPQASIAGFVPVSCHGGNNGSATASVTAGTAPFAFVWAPTGGNGSTASNLSAGNYTVTVTDGKQCTSTATVSILQPPAFVHTATAQKSTCGKANGSAAVIENGGTGAYTYAWSSQVSTTATASNLPAGNYVVTVSDAASCTDTIHVVVGNIPGVQATVSNVGSINCFGGNNGSVTISASVGTPPYTYMWAPAAANSPSITALVSGTYKVTVTDANQCTSTVEATVMQPAILQHTVAVTAAGCNGAGGTAKITQSGGTGPYSYTWSTIVAGNGPNANGLAAGNYTVTVTDAKGCTDLVQISIAQTPGVVASVQSTTNPSCFNALDGSISVSATGGQAPYSYVWSGGLGTSGVNLPAGQYTITVTDALGCTDTVSAELTNPAEMLLRLNVTGVSCPGLSDASIKVESVLGGIGPYLYSLNAGTAVVGPQFDGLKSGIYVLQVQDAGGCFVFDTISIAEPVTNSVDVGPDITIHLGEAIDLNGTLLHPNHVAQYAWQPPLNVACPSCLNTTAIPSITTTYTLFVTDSNGCVVSDARQIRVLPSSVYIPNIFAPGSSLNDHFTAFAGGGVDAIEVLQIFDRWGDLVFENHNFKPSVLSSGWDGTFRGEDAPAGVYAYYMKIKFIDGIVELFKGDVTVLR
ncbi:MAG: gliding motility-associated C-terminal domain-containing protein [Bacteroidota bacterium]